MLSIPIPDGDEDSEPTVAELRLITEILKQERQEGDSNEAVDHGQESAQLATDIQHP